ncbi:MAG: NAD(P)H dehydrogenase [Sphingomonadales bacterium]|nr:NAD(P)H dehydrogenase [Sphingomonadales bacterium]
MTRVLLIQASPRGAKSISTQVAQSHLAALTKQSAVEVDLLDVWKEPLPEFGGHSIDAKYAGLAGHELTAAQREAWAAIEKLGQRFAAADVLLFSVPMWNFGIPYRLKHLIDLVTQKDVLFRFNSSGFSGMLKKQSAVIVCARGLGYDDGSGLTEKQFDYQRSYLIEWLNFVGVNDIQTIRVERTLLGNDACDASISEGTAQAEAMAVR